MLTRILTFAGLLAGSWCVMTFTHELGHVVAGWLCGGTLQHADLVPWHLPYSIFDPDPMPLVTLWAGPLMGASFPVLMALWICHDWMWFVAHFCVLANGTYIAAAWYTGEPHLDTARLLANGAHPVTIALYCVVTIGFGYYGFRRSCFRIGMPVKS